MSIDPLGVTRLPGAPRDGLGRWVLTGPGFEHGHNARLQCLAAVIALLHKGVRVHLPLIFYPETAYSQGPRFVYDLPVPVDLEWLHGHAVLPGHLELIDTGGVGTCVRSGRLIVSSLQDPHAGAWSSNGWRAGEAYAGPVPDRLAYEPGDGSGLAPLPEPGRRADGTVMRLSATWRGIAVLITAVDAQTAWIMTPDRPALDPGGWVGDPRDRPGYWRRVPRAELRDVTDHLAGQDGQLPGGI